MIEQRIAEIKAHVERVLSMLEGREEPPQEVQEAIREFLQRSLQEIQQLRQQEKEQAELQKAESEQEQVTEELGPTTPPTQTGIGEPIPPLEPAPHSSSNINAFRYDPETQKLIVKFQDKFPGKNGSVYAYEGVPKYIFDIFARGAIGPKTSGKNAWHHWKKNVMPSHGAAMHALIKAGAFPYVRLR
jgi:hypothetical protein